MLGGTWIIPLTNKLHHKKFQKKSGEGFAYTISFSIKESNHFLVYNFHIVFLVEGNCHISSQIEEIAKRRNKFHFISRGHIDKVINHHISFSITMKLTLLTLLLVSYMIIFNLRLAVFLFFNMIVITKEFIWVVKLLIPFSAHQDWTCRLFQDIPTNKYLSIFNDRSWTLPFFLTLH